MHQYYWHSRRFWIGFAFDPTNWSIGLQKWRSKAPHYSAAYAIVFLPWAIFLSKPHPP